MAAVLQGETLVTNICVVRFAAVQRKESNLPSTFFMLSEFLLWGGLLAVLILVYEWIRVVRRYPPGPFPLPLIGNLHQLLIGRIYNDGITQIMRNWQKRYGNVFTFWLGPIPTVHIADYAIAKEEMVNNGSAYTSRYTPYVFDVKREGRGTVFSNGEFWADHRRFTLRTLRDFGLGSNILEDRIMDEFHYHFNKLEKSMVDGKRTIMAGEFFDLLVGSVINRMIFSERFTEENADEFFRVKHELDQNFMNMTAFDAALEKWTLNLPLFEKRWKKMISPQEKLIEFINKRVYQRKSDIASGKHILEEVGKDFVDAYLIKMEADRRDGVDNSRMYKDEDLLYDIFDLWIAGHETTSITMVWGFMHLIKNPEVVAKIRKEINSVTNGNRHISLADRKDTPYLNWTVLEIQRSASILNLNLWRKSEKNCVIGGRHVPAGTAIAAEMSLIMSDDKYFENPTKFDPDRYGRAGKSLELQVIPFGLGKRACIGESLAKAEIYLVLANMVSRYDVSEDPSAPIDMSTSTPDGVMRRPKTYKMILSLI